MIGQLIPILLSNPTPAAYRDYYNYVMKQGGTIQNANDTLTLIKGLKSLGVLDSTKLLWSSDMGMIIDPNTPGNTISKGFSADALHNDLVQPTKAAQPRLVGGIAPNSKVAASNQNGEARYFTHPAISFGATDAWSVTVVVDWKGNSDAFNSLFGRTVGGIEIDFRLRDNGVNKFALRSLSGATSRGADNGTNSLIGKRTVVNIIHNGAQTVSIYKNGVFFENLSPSTDSAVYFDSLLKGRLYNSSADILVYHIQSGAMSPAQVLAEYNLLRAMYPEIPSVVIGSQTWAVDNFRAVTTPMGNVIANVTEAGVVEKITDGSWNFTNWSKQSGVTVVDNNTFTTASGGIGIFKNIGLTVGRWSKIYFKGSSATGIYIKDTSSDVGRIDLPSGSIDGYYFYKTFGSASIYIASKGAGTIDVENFSVQELNWSNATEIYDAVYAATAGTTAEKEYAALKEAAMWCYYNNDVNNGAIYGKLYNWYAAKLLDLDMASAGFGYHVPTSAEFTTLANALGGASVAGGKMKMTGTNYWNTPNTGATNESGFTALGGGFRLINGSFTTLKIQNVIWGVESANNNSPLIILINNQSTATISSNDNKLQGCSLRLIKNS